MGVMEVVFLLVVGGVAGWLASLVVKKKSSGLILNVLIGLIGAFVGGFVFHFLGLRGYGLVGQLTTAFVGALILLALVNLLKK